jgi:biotin carboxylase
MILNANRGQIAVQTNRSRHEMGIVPVAYLPAPAPASEGTAELLQIAPPEAVAFPWA